MASPSLPSDRSRSLLLLAGVLTAALGIASRQYAGLLPELIARYAGDTLWALAAFIGCALLAPHGRRGRLALAALLLAYAVEISQLYHAPWLDALRNTRIGGLLLGHGFLWSDLLCYSVGVGMAMVLEPLWTRPAHRLAPAQRAEDA